MVDVDLEYVKKLENRIETLEEENETLRDTIKKSEQNKIKTPTWEIGEILADNQIINNNNNHSITWVKNPNTIPISAEVSGTFTYEQEDIVNDTMNPLEKIETEVKKLSERMDKFEKQTNIFSKIKNLFRGKNEKN